MSSEFTPALFAFGRVRDLAGRGDGTLCLANCTAETFLLVRAKGSGKLRATALLAGTEQPDAGGFVFRLCEPGWRAALGPGQALVLQARSGPCAGYALFSLQDGAGTAVASLAYAMILEAGEAPARGELCLQAQTPAAAGLGLVTHECLPGNVFLVREPHLAALREALDGGERLGGPQPLAGG